MLSNNDRAVTARKSSVGCVQKHSQEKESTIEGSLTKTTNEERIAFESPRSSASSAGTPMDSPRKALVSRSSSRTTSRSTRHSSVALNPVNRGLSVVDRPLSDLYSEDRARKKAEQRYNQARALENLELSGGMSTSEAAPRGLWSTGLCRKRQARQGFQALLSFRHVEIFRCWSD